DIAMEGGKVEDQARPARTACDSAGSRIRRAPHDRRRRTMKRSGDSKENFAGVSEDDIIRRIGDGEALAAIAASVGRARSTLSEWLNSDDARAERSARARACAAGA